LAHLVLLELIDKICYDTLFAFALQFGYNAKHVLEVGCAASPFIGHLDWIESRVCVAPYTKLHEPPIDNTEKNGQQQPKEQQEQQEQQQQQQPNNLGHVEMIQADFAEWTSPHYLEGKRYDLVICSQVVEHVHDLHAFFQKLLDVAGTAITSVPYK
jgi:SAM-dependent methyltransferase